MNSNSLRTLKAGQGIAVPLHAGDRVRYTNTHGTQVVDFWAVMSADPSERTSMEHTRRMTGRIHPSTGDALWSNRRTAMLEITQDATESTHDTMVAACDEWLYEHYGCPPGHRNCHDNFFEALEAIGVGRANHPDLVLPNPLNLWMNVKVNETSLTIEAPISKRGDSIEFKALSDVFVVASACPMDVAPGSGAAPVNGEDLTPKDVIFEVVRA